MRADELGADGDRWAAVGIAPGAAAVFDDHQPALGFRTVSFDPTCRFTGTVGSDGELGLSCGTSYPDLAPALYDPATATTVRVPPGPQFNNSREVADIGSKWVRLVDSGYHYENVESFYEWHTNAPAVLTGRSQVADLDGVSLSAKLCSPVARAPQTQYASLKSSPFYETAYDGHWLVSQRGYGKRDRDGNPRTVYLTGWLCGKPAARKLIRCTRANDVCNEDLDSDAMSVGSGVAMLFSGSAARIFYRRGGSATLPKPPFTQAPVYSYPEARLAHTRHFVFATVDRSATELAIANMPRR